MDLEDDSKLASKNDESDYLVPVAPHNYVSDSVSELEDGNSSEDEDSSNPGDPNEEDSADADLSEGEKSNNPPAEHSDEPVANDPAEPEDPTSEIEEPSAEEPAEEEPATEKPPEEEPAADDPIEEEEKPEEYSAPEIPAPEEPPATIEEDPKENIPIETPKPEVQLPSAYYQVPSYWDSTCKTIFKNSTISMRNLNYSPITSREVKEAQLVEYVVDKLGLKEGMPTVDALWKIHKYIIDNFSYAYDYDHDWPIEMLRDGKGGCNAAAELFKLVTRRCGIDSDLFLMYSSNGSDSHVSNRVKISSGNNSIYVIIDSTHSRGYGDSNYMFCESLYGAMTKYAFSKYSYVDFYVCDYRDNGFQDRVVYKGYSYNKNSWDYSTVPVSAQGFINAYNNLPFNHKNSEASVQNLDFAHGEGSRYSITTNEFGAVHILDLSNEPSNNGENSGLLSDISESSGIKEI